MLNRLITLMALVALALPIRGMTDEEQCLTVWNNLGDLLLIEDSGNTPNRYFQKIDMDDDGIDDLVIANDDKSVISAYSVGKEMGYITLTPAQRAELEDYWTALLDLPWLWPLPPDDITLREPPMFAFSNDFKANVFAGWYGENAVSASEYDHMVFKPHVAQVRFERQYREMSQLDDDTLFSDFRSYRLVDPTVTRKMFRGYDEGNALPVIVTARYLETHQPQQFSRWLAPEPRRGIDPDSKEIVEAHYGNRYRVVRAQWLATVGTEVGDRNYYQVVLVSPHKALAAVVCLAEGCVASACEVDCVSEEDMTADSDLIEFYGGTIDDLFDEHLPEISCVMFTQNGVELYLRYNSMEGTHYSVWREVGNRQIAVYDEYHYWMFQ